MAFITLFSRKERAELERENENLRKQNIFLKGN